MSSSSVALDLLLVRGEVAAHGGERNGRSWLRAEGAGR